MTRFDRWIGKVATVFAATTALAGLPCLAGEDVAPAVTAAVPAGETEPLYGHTFCRYKSPGPGMAFTFGLPIRVLADAVDQGGWQGRTRKMEAAEVRFFVDGRLAAAVEPAPDGYNYFETTLRDLAVGGHVLTVESSNYGNISRKSWPMPIVIEAPATHTSTVALSEDLVLQGTADLTWENATVRGNGFRVRSAPGWHGKVVLRRCLVTGLGSFSAPGIEVTTDGGSVTIEDSVFEATGAVHLRVDGSGDVTIRGNEFRSSNLIKFVSSDPGRSPVFRISGNTSGRKRFQSNRVGAGIVAFEGMNDWLIGGDTDEDSNILIGPRCVISLVNCRRCVIRGNYMHHDYNGGWSQGFNLICDNCQDLLAEHNVIRDSSWLVQSLSGEFRYNLVVNSGHNWIRTLTTGTKVHHNLFVHGVHGGGVNSGVWLYNDRKDVAVYNNTFDGGAPTVRAFAAPMIELSAGCSLATLRNNVFTGVASPENVGPRPVVDRGAKENAGDARIAYADYNCFWNPGAAKAANYAAGIAVNAGPHDVNADPRFAQGSIIPYPVNQSEVWNRRYGVSEVLAFYRRRYTPLESSPLVGAGDPADGKGSTIGAIGAGATASSDLFGRFGGGRRPHDGRE